MLDRLRRTEWGVRMPYRARAAELDCRRSGRAVDAEAHVPRWDLVVDLRCRTSGGVVDAEAHVPRWDPVVNLRCRTSRRAIDPAPIVAALARDPMFKTWYRLEGIVTTIDALIGDSQLDAHEEAVKQAAVADRIVLTKCDLADADRITQIRSRLAQLNPGARIIPAAHGEAELERTTEAVRESMRAF